MSDANRPARVEAIVTPHTLYSDERVECLMGIDGGDIGAAPIAAPHTLYSDERGKCLMGRLPRSRKRSPARSIALLMSIAGETVECPVEIVRQKSRPLLGTAALGWV